MEHKETGKQNEAENLKAANQQRLFFWWFTQIFMLVAFTYQLFHHYPRIMVGNELQYMSLFMVIVSCLGIAVVSVLLILAVYHRIKKQSGRVK